ncbi:ABC transporter permease [Agaribacterium sp. ZY112]|uniref:ABC transporter permease n=1 Tax=Agaribacterium sp. ZY112 TaxID=3233574 RepID=UPI003523D68A
MESIPYQEQNNSRFATQLKTWIKSNGALTALILLLLANALITPNFFAMQTLYINLTQVTPIAIVAIGMCLVIASGGGGIDISVGSVLALAGALAPLVFMSDFGINNPALGIALAITLPLLVASFCGLFNGFLVGHYKIQPMIATLVLFISGRGIAQVLTGGDIQTFNNKAFQYIGTGKILGLPVQALILILMALAVSIFIKKSMFGRYLLAVGGNEKAASLCGLPSYKVKLAVYAFCGFCAGLAGLFTTAINSASDANTAGLLMELDAIAAAVVGGTIMAGGRAPVIGAVIGALVIQMMSYTLLANGISDSVAMVAKAVIIIAAIYLQMHSKNKG